MAHESEEIDFMERFNRYAEQLYELFKSEGYVEDYLVARFMDEIEGDGFHVDFLGLPYVTTAVLMFHDEKNRQIHIKVIDNIGIRSFTFSLKTS